jgi:hypothetical protein
MSGVARLDAADVRATTEVEQPPAMATGDEGVRGKRDGEGEVEEREGRPGKRRRVEPTRVSRV